jgi:hypothetical protein
MIRLLALALFALGAASSAQAQTSLESKIKQTKRTDMGPIAPVAPGSRLETQEGISYLVPDGWTVKQFYGAGSALLTDSSRNYHMAIKRSGLQDKELYTNKETLPSGLVLEWKHYELLKGWGLVMTARARLSAGFVELHVTTLKGSVDKGFGLKLIRGVADSVKIVGKPCIGNCGPGKIVSN